MSRACSPGGRFSTDFETQAISNAINMDLRNPVGTKAQWWVFDSALTDVDPVYDTGDSLPTFTGGKVWVGPYTVPIIRAVITQGQAKTSQMGFYNADFLHLTVNATDMERFSPGIMNSPDDTGRHRIVWKGEVWRPYQAQQKGVVAEGFTLLSLDCIQVMPEELVNDPQFLDYVNGEPPPIYPPVYPAYPPQPEGPFVLNSIDGGTPGNNG